MFQTTDPRPSTQQNTQQKQEPIVRVEHARPVIEAVTAYCEKNAALPEEKRLAGDALTIGCVDAALKAATALPKEMQAKAFLAGLAVAIDNSGTLNVLVPDAETAEQRAKRSALVEGCTLHGRRDLAQHFFVSVALAVFQGPALAESVGLAKEVKDMNGGTGFSFADLAADFAGVAFARKMLDAPEIGKVTLPAAASGLMPDPVALKLAEGLKRDQFTEKFGSAFTFPLNKEYQTEVTRIRDAINGLRKE